MDIYPDCKWEAVFLGGSAVFRKDIYLDFDALINFFHNAYSTRHRSVPRPPPPTQRVALQSAARIPAWPHSGQDRTFVLCNLGASAAGIEHQSLLT